ncbi:bifunctional 2-polyprenyl-6-hydroxyphenol methylase/3-demethylubiquinol 3-O-methyltransferase UbiG [Pseudophaeobacter sp. EL27]|uniref:class I SAM-dependent methyltransferase n=1 Tax=Pseudophaeobacter sp. EL27 TaxID=2107580 RepID=UPI000EFAB850|nr:class I SAM-dependent methyltransferase [Pseudophaeobacter sp. EL27]
MWEERFATSEDYVYGTAPTGFLIAHSSYLLPGQKALSIADGEGRNSVYLAEQGLDVTALEFAPSALAQARNVFVDYRACDILTDSWQETNTYDLVLAVFVQFTGPEGRARQFDGMKVSCKPGGLVMIHGYTPKQLEFGTGGPPSEQNMYTEAQMRADFAGWDILECTSYEREVQEGAGHSGMSALLDFVARKPS